MITGNNDKQECIPVGCVPPAAVTVSPATHYNPLPPPSRKPPATHAPCHATPRHTCPPATHAPLPYMPPPPCTSPTTYAPPATHAPLQHMPPATHIPLPHTYPCHTCPPAMHAPATHIPLSCTPPPDRMTDVCKNITFPQTSFAGGNNLYIFHFLMILIHNPPIATHRYEDLWLGSVVHHR